MQFEAINELYCLSLVFVEEHLFSCRVFVRFKARHNFVAVCLELAAHSFQHLADTHH